MLKNISRTILLPALALAVFAVPAAAQDEGDGGVQNAVDAQVADLENLRDKFLALAEAFPEDTYEWRPMEGVRSVHDVMALCTPAISITSSEQPVQSLFQTF